MKQSTAKKAEKKGNNEEFQVTKPKSKANKVISNILNVVLVVALILAAVCTYISYVSTSGSGVPSIFGLELFTIQTDSMYPALSAGDLVIDTKVKDASELRQGDIITYWTVIDGERVLNTHRIYEIYDGGDYLIFATKGDNNTAADALTVHESEVVGKYKTRIGGVGKVLDYLQTSTGFLLVVVIPVFIFFLYHLVQFFRVLFEYQNVKNRIKYEQERGRTEDIIAAEKRQQAQAKELERAAMEAEIREKLRAEMLASMSKENTAATAAPAQTAAKPKPAAPKAAAPVQQAEEEFDDEELLMGGSLDDLLFGGDDETV